MHLFLSLVFLLGLVAAEDGRAAWLRYAPLPRSSRYHYSVPSQIVALDSNKTSPVYTAGSELQRGINSIFGTNVSIEHSKGTYSSSIVVGTVDQYTQSYGELQSPPELVEDGFWLSNEGNTVHILGQNERGALYGAFKYLDMLGQGNFSKVTYASNPESPIRWVNQWDNLDGSIERGYGGLSIFFSDGTIREDLTRVTEYARLMASVGINAIVLNNVNANPNLLSSQNRAGLRRIADAIRPYGIRIGISLNFASPTLAVPGERNLTTFDPLDDSVIEWWTDITNKIYNDVPDLAGYLVKANSEGQPGPQEYNRTLAEGANLFARAIQPHGGIVMFRAFVYDQLNQSNWEADRANAAVQFFKPLDGEFDDNVVVQIKYGPIDFQVREPPSPLFANIPNTNLAIELQVTQEYLGQQSHLVYLPPLWRTILDFDLRIDGETSYVRDVISGKFYSHKLGGGAAVVNVGLNQTWLGSHLALSNLYAYGRLMWDSTSDSEAILQDWIRLTFGSDQNVLDTITDMSMASWHAYESYTGNLGIQTLTDILYTHYACNPASQDNNGWGQWTRANTNSVGMDRTVRNGTGFSGTYPPEVAQRFEHLESTPDDLLLWFHHVPWTYRLQSGETVIQHFYNAHYSGAEIAHKFLQSWQGLEGKIDSERYDDILYRQAYQAGHSIEWRDCVNNYYYNMTGIPDQQERVENHPWRVEAEDMELDGYKVYQVNPFETASGANAIVTTSNTTQGTASATLDFPSGTYDLAINYFDMWGGISQYEIWVGGKKLGNWAGDHEGKLSHQMSSYLDAHSASRKTFHNVKIQKGDTVRIVGTPGGVEPAPIDYVVVLPKGLVD